MSVNIPELRKRVEAIEEQDALTPSERWWLQGHWSLQGPTLQSFAAAGYVSDSCGTARCFAGDTVLAHLNPGEVLRGPDVIGLTGIVSVCERAIEILGITHYESRRLFDSNNSAKDIRRIAEEIAGERL